MKKYIKHMTTLVFLVVIFIFFLSNGLAYKNMASVVMQSQGKKLDQIVSDISDTHKVSFKERENLIDLFGLTMRVLGKDIIGNFEYIKDDTGIIHMFEEPFEPKGFLEELVKLNDYCNNLQTPLLYVQVPPRVSSYGQFPDNYTPSYQGAAMDYWCSEAAKQGVSVLNFQDQINRSQNAVLENVYFRTDAHMTTQAEWELMNLIVEWLEKNQNISLYNRDAVLNINNYKTDSREFVGNFARSVGGLYTEAEYFDLLFPLFETDMTYYDENDQAVKQGSFEQALTNQFHHDPTANKYTYWVTNYGQFTKTNYRFENNAIDEGPNILVVMDSNGYRTISYLSLMCKNVVVVDSRYANYRPVLMEQLNQRNYDAVIVMQGYGLQMYPLLIETDMLNAEITYHNIPTVINREDNYTFNITVKNSGTTYWTESEQIRLCIWKNGSDLGYRIYLPQNITVAPGEEYTFTMGFDMPFESADVLEFQMVKEGVCYFGEKKAVTITAAN